MCILARRCLPSVGRHPLDRQARHAFKLQDQLLIIALFLVRTAGLREVTRRLLKANRFL
jgi:hypothetical protein